MLLSLGEVSKTSRGGGGSLKFAAEGRKTLTPPKNSSKDMYLPLNCQQQSRPPLNFSITTWTPPKTRQTVCQNRLKNDNLGQFWTILWTFYVNIIMTPLNVNKKL